MKLIEVKTKNEVQKFHQFQIELYKNDAFFIPPIQQDVTNIFDPTVNTNFQTGDAKRWILEIDGKIIGRIAAFYNTNKNEAGLGFFDVINSEEASKKLFDVGLNWIKSNGFNRVLAPVNFGERDTFWGLLTYTERPVSYLENYHKNYYQSFFENYGFQKLFEQTTGETNIQNVDIEALEKANKLVFQKYGFTAKHFKYNQIEKFAQDFVTIYNKAWGTREGNDFRPMTKIQILKLFQKMKPIIREDLLWFAYKGDEPIGFYLNVLDINQVFKFVGGNLNFLGKMKFLFYRKYIHIDKIRGIVFGIVPEYQGKGAYIPMIHEMYQVLRKDPYIKDVELSWIGDFNPKMHSLFKNLKAKTVKIHQTYRIEC